MKLTQHESGSLREIWSISWPMILAAMSNYFMTLADRIILSKYSTEVYVAASGSHPFYWANTRAMMAFIMMTSVFISQFHGAHNYRQIGKIVWQAIFISFAYYIVLIPCALNGKAFLAETIETLGAPYLSITLLFLPFHLAGFGAIGSFFMGIGRMRIVPIVILISNIINIVLDFFLIFGWGNPGEMGVSGALQLFKIPRGFIDPILGFLSSIGLEHFPAMGIRGAAYATGISQLTAFLVFLCQFLRKPYRRRYRTHVPKLSLRLIKKCLPLGIPNAINSILNSGGFAIVYQIIAKVCLADDLLAFTIANSIYLFFWFFADGLGKGLCTICSNYIGQSQMEMVFNAARSVVKLLLVFIFCTAIFMIFQPRLVLNLFYAGEVTDVFFVNFRWILFVAWIALIAEAIRWMFQNIIISAGDVHFTVISNVSCFWLGAFAPIFFFVYYLKWGGAMLCWQFFTVDSCARIISDYFRLRSATWQRKALEAAKFSQIDPQNTSDQSSPKKKK
ncbi:MAG: MATE family efflux transporter [Puniceicoccales bacterium]|jgi:MATE family multidrug resistance protein|nr:MATE family efflux transporter [Puniceicoccales bacterium]